MVSTLNTFEFKVYNYVIKNHQTVIYMTVRELAEACDVSTATILRFCKKMNCSGYAEFKAYLKMNAEKRGEISLPHGANEFLSFFKSINNDEFDALIASAAEQIAGAERVIFV
ncbi:MurR/RpiR family transcriptional regulator, partial [Aeromonas caviae]|uniref:MurR/RpiR family transcriptional regulator n=5 Tax=Aeromonadaceae TaxID=84642 RepID=UPI0035A22B65